MKSRMRASKTVVADEGVLADRDFLHMTNVYMKLFLVNKCFHEIFCWHKEDTSNPHFCLYGASDVCV